jgi:hypothetical protein
MRFKIHQPCSAAALILFGISAASVLILAQTSSAPPIASFIAATDNLVGQHDSVRIDVTRWSTNAERDQLTAAWKMAPPPVAEARGGGKGKGGKGKGGEPAPLPKTPEESLAAALERVASAGTLWTQEMAGYTVRYAARFPAQDGGERIILITERRLGAWNNLWRPVSGTPSSYEFSVLELHLNAKGEGEGKATVTGKVTVDDAAKTIALDHYAALPPVLKNVKGPSLDAGVGK